MSEENENNRIGTLWYSRGQKMSREGCSTPLRPIYGKLTTGKVVECTEIKTGKWKDEPSNWGDAICLGEGEFSHLG